jgi:hypothetical protein
MYALTSLNDLTMISMAAALPEAPSSDDASASIAVSTARGAAIATRGGRSSILSSASMIARTRPCSPRSHSLLVISLGGTATLQIGHWLARLYGSAGPAEVVPARRRHRFREQEVANRAGEQPPDVA